MFWDKLSFVYDLMETLYNRKVFIETGVKVAEYIDRKDVVLECACGTGAISVYIAPKCKKLFASDFSVGMLKKASKKCRKFHNVIFKKADITNLKCKDNRFDKVVAGNVIHLLDDPKKALDELERVVKPGGKIIIPTYINMVTESSMRVIGILDKMGANFKRQFDFESYKQFFEDMGYKDVEYFVVEGKMPCAIAVITTNK